MLPHEGSFLESDVPHAAHLYNSPLRGMCIQYHKQVILTKIPVRAIKSTLSSYIDSPFSICGAQNVVLETIKRGEDDNHTSSISTPEAGPVTVILRLYEVFGGHARVLLRIAPYLPVAKVFVTNLLEDEEEELDITQSANGGIVDNTESSRCSVTLNFRGFEVKTLKVVIGSPSSPPPSPSIQQECVLSSFL